MTKKRKPRKPGPLKKSNKVWQADCEEHKGYRRVWVDCDWRTAPQARRLAAWLIRAADWIEAQEGNG